MKTWIALLLVMTPSAHAQSVAGHCARGISVVCPTNGLSYDQCDVNVLCPRPSAGGGGVAGGLPGALNQLAGVLGAALINSILSGGNDAAASAEEERQRQIALEQERQRRLAEEAQRRQELHDRLLRELK